MKLYQLIWSAVIILLLASCNKNWFSQNPLEGVPKPLREGVLETGSGEFSIFDDFVVGKMLRLTLNNESKNILEFKEGEERVYKIQLELLNEFDSKYEILDFENPFSDLTGGEWAYDSETKTGELRWTPDRAFNKGNFYKKLDFQIPVRLKKTGYPRKNSSLTVLKDLQILVHKSAYKPEIIALQTNYRSYIKLDDGLFYEDTRIKSLNLNYYNKLFVPRFIISQSSHPDHPGPSGAVYQSKQDLAFKGSASDSEANNGFLINPKTILHRDIFKVTDEKEKLAPYAVFSYLKRPYYELVKSKDRPDCAGLKDQKLCWAPLKNIENLPPQQAVYVKNYIIPKKIRLKGLYYKVNSALACEVYDKLGASQKIKDSVFKDSYSESEGRICYLPSARLNLVKDNLVSEAHSVYLLEEGELQQADITKWEESFEEIPLFLKLQMSGHKAVDKINISYRSLSNYNKLSFKIRDENYFGSAPDLYFENIMNEGVYSLLPVQFKFNSVENIDDSLFKVEFYINVEKQDEYKKYRFQTAPSSLFMKGESVLLDLSVLPSILKETEYYFNPESDLTKEVLKKDETWAKTEINIEAKIKRRYAFPASFYNNLNFGSLLSNIGFFKKNIIIDEVKFSGSICNPNRASDFLKTRSCSCSEEESFYKDEENNIYMESICHYSAQLHLLPSHLENNISGYIQYDYRIENQLLFFPDYDIIGNRETKRRVSIDERNYLASKSETGYLNEDEPEELIIKKEIENEEVSLHTPLHLFFNLEPSWKCEESSQSEKKNCKITYFLKERNITSTSLSTSFMNQFLKDQIKAETKCFLRDRDGLDSFFNKAPCDCSDIKISYSNFELSCDFESETFMELRLKTDHPHIYFFSKEEEGNKQTPLERINI